jgi:hypothetical protein
MLLSHCIPYLDVIKILKPERDILIPLKVILNKSCVALRYSENQSYRVTTEVQRQITNIITSVNLFVTKNFIDISWLIFVIIHINMVK